MDTWYKQIEPTETVKLSQPAGNLPLCLCETTNMLIVLLFCDVHIDIDKTLNSLQCGEITGTADSYCMYKLCIELLSQYLISSGSPQ